MDPRRVEFLKKRYADPLAEMRYILRSLQHDKAITYYDGLCCMMETIPLSPRDRLLYELLNVRAIMEYDEGRPLLPVLVGHPKTGYPNRPFCTLARDLGVLKPPTRPQDWCRHERKLLFSCGD